MQNIKWEFGVVLIDVLEGICTTFGYFSSKVAKSALVITGVWLFERTLLKLFVFE